MSAKGRGADLGGAEEVYPTPAWAVHRLLDRVGAILEPGKWLEPCAGYGAIIRAAHTHPTTIRQICWHAVEIRPEVEELLAASTAGAGAKPVIFDFQKVPQDSWLFDGVKVVITNPPFSLALPILLHALASAPRAHVAFLLRTNFISGADDRYSWLVDHMPDEYRIPERPSFRGEGSDSAEYSWFLWGPGAGSTVRRRGHSELLDSTPLEVRKRDKEEAAALLSGVEFIPPQLGLFGGVA